MKKNFTLRYLLLVFIVGLSSFKGIGQNKLTTIVNYDFNSGATYPALAPSLAANITCAATSTEAFVTFAGAPSGAGAFTVNSTPGNALGMNNSSGTNTRYFQFQLGGSSLADNFNYKIYFQAQRSVTGATTITLAYSTDGVTYINFPATQSPGNGSFVETPFDLSSITSLNNQSNIYFRLLVSGASGTGTFRIDNFQIQGQTTPKYYRSQNSGDWTNTNTWQSSIDNSTWSNATLIPSSVDKTISIQTGHTVTSSASISLDETIINGTLQVFTGGVLNINHPAVGNDIDIQNNGLLQVLSTDTYTNTIKAGTSVIAVETGGKITIGNGGSVGAGYEAFATSGSNIWNDASVFEWNSSTAFTFSGNTYFPNAVTTIPKFIITNVSGSVGASGDVTVNGLLTINTNVAITGSGRKFIRDGISGNNTLTLDATNGACNITSATSEISGTLTLILNKDLHINSGTTVTSGSIITVSNSSTQGLIRDAGTLLVDANARLDMGSAATITNTATGNVTVTGTLVTAKAGGLMGTGATISITTTVILNSGSTIEYNANGAQSIQGATLPNYYNVTFSGSGTKTLQSTNIPAGTITVSGSAIFDAQNFTFGGAGTNLTMTGTSRYINGGATTKPDAQGTYSLGINTIIEFANNSGTIIRLGLSPISYANIVVSGTNVSNASTLTGILFQSGGSFIVTPGATFKLQNASGFTGSATTAISITNNPFTLIQPGSTIEYSGATAQVITNQFPYYNLSITGSGIKTAPSGILTVLGNLTKSGTSTFAHNGGTVLLTGFGAQSFAGLTYNNLILTNSTKTTSGSSTIIDSIKINDATALSISSSDTITLHSDATKTARIGQIGTGTISYNSTGKFLVERYIPAKKAWRFLSVPTNSTQTIKRAWQEGAAIITDNLKPTYGTIITSNIATWSVNGFDEFSSGGPSMKTYNSSTNNYDGIASTNAPFLPFLGGYFIFIRGDRTATAYNSPVTGTTLRTAGQLFTGIQPLITINNQFTPINNPYASQIDLVNLSTVPAYYVWDPNRGGLYGFGGFTTFSWNIVTGTFDAAPQNTGSYGTTNNLIDNGQSFLASKLGAPTSIQFTENAKAGSTLAISPFTPIKAPGQQLRSDLYAIDTDGTWYIADGVLNTYSDNYSNSIDGMDAKKNINPTVNLSIERDNMQLAIERRQTLRTADTVFFQISNFRAKGTYRFVFTPNKIEESGLQPYLEDNYLTTKTALNVNDTTQVNFVTDGSADSAASNRFRIVFDAAAGVLRVTFTNARAYLKNENIIVEWNVENETGIRYYQVQKSLDGTSFTPAVAVIAHNNQPGSSYNWLDVQPVAGYNYYRIKSIGINGEINYSKILQVFAGNRKNGITVYPNPASNGIIHLQFSNQSAGKYVIRLINKSGQVIVAKEIQRTDNGSSTEIIPLDTYTAHGVYRLEVTRPDGSQLNINMIY